MSRALAYRAACAPVADALRLALRSNKRKAAGRKVPTALEGEITELSYLTLVKYRPTSGNVFVEERSKLVSARFDR